MLRNSPIPNWATPDAKPKLVYFALEMRSTLVTGTSYNGMIYYVSLDITAVVEASL